MSYLTINKINELNPKLSNFVSKTGNLSSAQLRLFLGLTALFSKTGVDYYTNRKIDNETRTSSVLKTLTKIIIGTTTGVLARSAGQKYGRNLVKRGILRIPADITKKIDRDKFIEGAANTLAFVTTIAATLLLDIPIINKIVGNIGKNSQRDKMSSINEVV